MSNKSSILDIIIVNYQSTRLLINCLRSIYNDLNGYPVNIHVQDNASIDGIESIKEMFPAVNLTLNKRNIGFARAINQSIRGSRSPYVMIVNPDTIIQKHFFKTVIQYMEENPTIGIVGPKVLNSDGSVQGSARAFPTPFSGFFGRTSFLSKWFPNNWFTRNNILTKKINGTHPVEVDWVSGACMVIRKSALDDIGLLDERFYMYWEDVDWCKRMWIKGWRIIYYPKAELIHYVGGSSNKRPLRSLYEFHKSCYRYFLKYETWPALLLKLTLFIGLSSRFLLLAFLNVLRPRKIKTGHLKPKILFLITEDWYFWSHRLSLARAARNAGFEVLIATRVHQHQELIKQEGFRLIPIQMERKGRNLIKEIQNFIELVKIYKGEKPDIVHHVALKPVLYGSWAARLTRVPLIVNAIAGLGYIFVTQGKKVSIFRKIAQFAYRTAFLPDNTIGIFQNPEDLDLFVRLGIVKSRQTTLIRGSGVDTTYYRHTPEKNGIPRIVLASRMLWDKGVGEYVEAAQRLKQQGLNYRFLLVGDPDPENPMSIPQNTLSQWNRDGLVEWYRHSDNIPEVFSNANLVVLPSYREGLPKVLLEAAACGRALVATDVPGCREIVRNDENGTLVPPYDSENLAGAIKDLIENKEKRIAMGIRNREIAVKEFAQEIVVQQTMEIYQSLFKDRPMPFSMPAQQHVYN